MGLCESDTVLPVVPMFHANAWGLPYAAVMTGARLVMPGPHLDPASLVDLFVRERVTLTAGVPTIWMGVQQLLDANPGAYDLSSLRAMFIGGAAVPQSMIEAFEKRHGLHIVHAWGMTEMAPLGTIGHLPHDLAGAPDEAKFGARAKRERPGVARRRDDGRAGSAGAVGRLRVLQPS
jgi:fatty-acyl-CoA synthase